MRCLASVYSLPSASCNPRSFISNARAKVGFTVLWNIYHTNATLYCVHCSVLRFDLDQIYNFGSNGVHHIFFLISYSHLGLSITCFSLYCNSHTYSPNILLLRKNNQKTYITFQQRLLSFNRTPLSQHGDILPYSTPFLLQPIPYHHCTLPLKLAHLSSKVLLSRTTYKHNRHNQHVQTCRAQQQENPHHPESESLENEVSAASVATFASFGHHATSPCTYSPSTATPTSRLAKTPAP